MGDVRTVQTDSSERNTMRRSSLYTVGRQLDDETMYILSVIDLEPAGVLIHAYNQANSEELTMPVSEAQVGNYRWTYGH